ncbi:hypothetical protein [Thiomicrorhabdus indica]|uniref:hypothetical protein n=1 Tax=Thiomicrorhabdus indica TaxID=2267253 RepID=UPI002AA6AAE0|nr:hypothetical protein [Thiomicrorhabdus indica]
MTTKTTKPAATTVEKKPVAAKSVAAKVHRGGSYKVADDGTPVLNPKSQTKPGLTKSEKRAKAEAQKTKGAN